MGAIASPTRAPRLQAAPHIRKARATPSPHVQERARPPPSPFAARRVRPRAQARAHSVAAQLLAEAPSPYALHGDPSFLHELMQRVDDAADAGANANTAKGESSAWNKYYAPYCRRLRTAMWRGLEALSNPRREGAFLTGFALTVWERMQPRAKEDPAPRVDSVRNVIGHIRRAHARRGQLLVDDVRLAHVMKGIAKRRLVDHGISLPRRAEPFTAE